MRIAIFSDTYAPEINGVARTLTRYTSYLEKQGIAYRLFIPASRSPIPSIPHVQRFASIPFLLYRECRLALPNPILIKQTLDEFRPTLIHIATPFNLGLYGLHYAKKAKVPMIASYHTHFDGYLDYYRLGFLKGMILKYMTWFHAPMAKVYVPSPSVKEKLIGERVHRDIEIWGRGVNSQFYSPLKRSAHFREKYRIRENHIILYVGRIAPEKDIDIVLDTFHSLPEEIRRDSHLVLVGDGPLLKKLSDKKSENMTYTGFLEGTDLAEVYASGDLFLFPSSTETFGNVVLEAMASGLPVVGARAGGVQHLIDHGRNGLLCEAGNVGEFVNAVSLLLANKPFRSALGNQARQFALMQSWDRIFAQLLSSFEQVQQKDVRASVTA